MAENIEQIDDEELFDDTREVDVPAEVMQEFTEQLEADAIEYEKELLAHAREFEKSAS